MVCTTSKWSAFLRDMKLKLARMLGKLPDGPPSYPPISQGTILAGTAAAGSYFPQFVADGTRLDDLLGTKPCLITRADLDGSGLKPFRAQLTGWFEQANVEAVFVRPDHYVFGTGNPVSLRESWSAASKGY